MVKGTILCLVQLGLLYGVDQPHAQLPQYVFKADFCPNTNDSSQWKDASDRLHCLHDLDSTDAGNVYHCLPTSFLNETVEFCGKAITVPPGYCPIYNYTEKSGDVPGLYNCSAFISGCPSESFSSKDVRKFSSCLNINRKHGGFKDERNTSVTCVPKQTTNGVQTTTIPTYIYVGIIVFGACIYLIIGLLIICLRYRYLFLQMKERTAFPTGTRNEGSLVTCKTDENTSLLPENKTDPNSPIKTTMYDASWQTKDMVMTKHIQPESDYFTKLLERIEGHITDDIWNSMKIHLRTFVDRKRVEKMIPTKMLKELSDMLKLQYNISFLEWIFDNCGAPNLVKDCRQYSAKNQFQLKCFKTNFTPSAESQTFDIQFMKFELESYMEELQDVRCWLAKTIHVHPGQILMTNLKNGPIVATFLMRENHANAILEYLKTDDGRIAASKQGIEKIVQNGNVIEIGKSLNGSNFVNIKSHVRGNVSEIHDAVRKLASTIFQHTGLTIEGNEIYIRTVPSDEKQYEIKGKPVIEESFIEKNRKLILENIEPLTIVEQTNIADLFNREDLAGMKDITGRRDQAEYFLKLCDMLPNEKREIACTYLEDIFSLPKEKSTYNEELSPAKEWIQQHREDLLDEIDSEFIESTIYHLEDVPEEIKTSWSDPNKSRKERAKLFLDFALQKDEYAKALNKTIEKNKMQFLG